MHEGLYANRRSAGVGGHQIDPGAARCRWATFGNARRQPWYSLQSRRRGICNLLIPARVEFYAGELFPRVGFIVTNLGNLWRGVPFGPGAAAAGGQLVLDERATAVGEDGGPADQARALLLAAPGRGASDMAALRGHGASGPRGHPGVASVGRIGGRSGGSNRSKEGKGPERCMRNRWE